jgi:site-specific DNA recombinase
LIARLRWGECAGRSGLPDEQEDAIILLRDPRSIRSETRATLVAAIARGRRWLKELVEDASITVERIAKREWCSIRKVNMTISLAFLAPDLVKAAIEGRLPRGMGVARLVDAPAEWSRQHQMLGLPAD